LDSDLNRVKRLIELGNQLHLSLSLDRCQELYFNCLQTRIEPECRLAIQAQLISGNNNASEMTWPPLKTNWHTTQLRQLLQLGEKLAVDVSPWLSQLP
jgi:hypothetical protein